MTPGGNSLLFSGEGVQGKSSPHREEKQKHRTWAGARCWGGSCPPSLPEVWESSSTGNKGFGDEWKRGGAGRGKRRKSWQLREGSQERGVNPPVSEEAPPQAQGAESNVLCLMLCLDYEIHF